MSSTLNMYQETTAASSGSTTIGPIALDGGILVGVALPASIDSTAMTITVCDSETGTYLTVYADGANVSFTVAASKFINCLPQHIMANWLKVVMGTAEVSKIIKVLYTQPLK